jgi:hypothetical protein
VNEAPLAEIDADVRDLRARAEREQVARPQLRAVARHRVADLGLLRRGARQRDA